MKIMIDPGHGGNDPGATYENVQEADTVLLVANLVTKKLSAAKHDVFMTRTGREVQKIRNWERAKLANEKNVDIFVALHCNAAQSSRAEDAEVIYCPGSTKGKLLALCLYDALMETDSELSDSSRRRGIKTDDDTGRGPFTVLRKTRMPAVIVEMAFMSHEEDRRFVNSDAGQRIAASAILNGITDYELALSGGKK